MEESYINRIMNGLQLLAKRIAEQTRVLKELERAVKCPSIPSNTADTQLIESDGIPRTNVIPQGWLTTTELSKQYEFIRPTTLSNYVSMYSHKLKGGLCVHKGRYYIDPVAFVRMLDVLPLTRNNQKNNMYRMAKYHKKLANLLADAGLSEEKSNGRTN